MDVEGVVKMALKLKVNLYKSCSMGINVSL